jgi:hypothetical protein
MTRLSRFLLFVLAFSTAPAYGVTAVAVSARNVAASGATLYAVVNPGGTPVTSIVFGYDLSTSSVYTNSVNGSPFVLDPTEPNTTILADIGGLACGTSYHFIVTAFFSGGSAQSNAVTFTTSSVNCPAAGGPSVFTQPATAVADTGATLNGTVNDIGAASPAAVTFEYGITTAYGTTVIATPATVASADGQIAVHVDLTGLACSTLYHFRVDATNASFSTLGNDRGLDTAPCAAGVDDTGEDECYDGTSLVACTAATAGDGAGFPRQDGRFGRDPAANGLFVKKGTGEKGFDYTKICLDGDVAGQNDCPAILTNADGTRAGSNPVSWACTRDNVTNLLWSSQGSHIGTEGPQFDSANWAVAVAHVATIDTRATCGYSDGWRLPTLQEMNSLVHNLRQNPALDTDYFYILDTYAPGTEFWTADTDVSDSTQVATLLLDNGIGGADFKTALHDAFYVRSLPGPAPAPVAYTDNGDGTVTDARTGLMWDQCTWGLSGTTPGSQCTVGSASSQFWQQTLGISVTANAMNGGTGYKGHHDWRVPNKNELMSIADPTQTPAIDSTVFPNTIEAWYWTSTTYFPSQNSAWIIDFGIDGPNPAGKTLNQPFAPFVPPYLRLVRGGELFDSFDFIADMIFRDGFGN